MQSHCPSGPEDLDFFLIPICWCSAAWGGDLEAGFGGGLRELALQLYLGARGGGGEMKAYVRTFNGLQGC